MFRRWLFWLIYVSLVSQCSLGEPSTCLMIYREGGAPAVFQSPKCPKWTLSFEDVRRRKENCQLSILQGRRLSQEDRAICAFDLLVPFPSTAGIKEINIGIAAVFDGHNGAEASDLASKHFLEYYFLHVYFLLDGIYSTASNRYMDWLPYYENSDLLFQIFNQYKEQRQHDLDKGYRWMLPHIFERPFRMEILKESLLRTIHDIDTAFSKEAQRKNLTSGTTATIVLVAEGGVITANVGDSKALLCSEKIFSEKDIKSAFSKSYKRKRRNNPESSLTDYENVKLKSSGGLTYFCVRELTEDHHPDRDDERIRVEAAGGFIAKWGSVARVNGELAISRAIGDIPYKQYGVISIPEVSDWQPLTSNDSYVVVASDGVFEKITTQEICDILWNYNRQDSLTCGYYSKGNPSLADCIVASAFERGSMDNMAAIVVPLESIALFKSTGNKRCDVEERSGSWHCTQWKQQSDREDETASTALLPIEYIQRIMAKFNRLLVEGTYENFGCFYLSENLDASTDYVFKPPNANEENKVLNSSRELSETSVHVPGYSLDLYNDQHFCLHFGLNGNGDHGSCLNPELLTRFIGLLQSVPLQGYDSGESYGYDPMEFRYVLKRRFDRGSYGEVWLAFHWNCSNNNFSSKILSNENDSIHNLRLDQRNHDSSAKSSSSSYSSFSEDSTDDSLILKRIMVERGNIAYLSGLREKHFGELFLKASSSLERTTRKEILKFPSESQCDLYSVEEILNPSRRFHCNVKAQKFDSELGLNHIARYVESFESRSGEIWLVFRNEGLSLSKLLYSCENEKLIYDDQNKQNRNLQVMHPSEWWKWMRMTKEGQKEMRNLIWQLLMALKSCHERNITHRDIKPENMVICLEDGDTGRCARKIPNIQEKNRMKMRLIDFGSAIDDFTMKNMYGANGPSRSEQTYEYAPPEALLNATWFRGPPSRTLKYDMWSVGVVMLEMILGTPHVFQINSRTHALLDQHLEGWNDGMKELAYRLRSLMEMCILVPGSSPQHNQKGGLTDHVEVSPVSWKCSEDAFSLQIKNKDPLKLGFPNVWALRLVRQLLQWYPDDRLSVDEALGHPYFITES